jgi:hypothetical protein
VDGSPVNAYAPFYLWRDVGAMGAFLAGGGGFQGIVADFGRPAVRHWTGAACERGPAYGAAPYAASRRTAPFPPGEDPAAAVERALAEARALAATDGAHTTAVAFDPCAWELVRFTLWAGAVPADEDPAAERFRVLHLSAPELAAVAVGRRW